MSLNDTTGVTEYFWEFLDKPKDSVAVFSDPTAAEPTFTPDVDLTSTYLIQCTVNDGESRSRIALAFGTENLDIRKLAAGEGPQYDALKGWVEAYNDFVDKVDALTPGGNVTGPNPSTLRGIATYANLIGTALLDNSLRIETGQRFSGVDYRAIQALDDEGSPSWRDLVGLDYEEPNGSAGGYRVIVGDQNVSLLLVTSGEPQAEGLGGRGKILYEKITIPWELEKYGGISITDANTQRIFHLGTTGSNGAQVDLYAGTGSPQGVVTADPGSIYYRIEGVDSTVYQHRGSISSDDDWEEFGDVVGPSISGNSNIVLFDGTTGRLLKNSVFRQAAGSTLQTKDPVTPFSWVDTVGLNYYAPNGIPEDTYVELGDTANGCIIIASGDPWVDKSGSGFGRLIHENVGSGWNIKNWGHISDPGADTQQVLRLETHGTNGVSINLFMGNRDPNGFVTGSPGDFYYRSNGVSSTEYQHKGASSSNNDWVESGDVVGPSLVSSNRLAVFDGTTGKLLKQELVRYATSGTDRSLEILASTASVWLKMITASYYEANGIPAGAYAEFGDLSYGTIINCSSDPYVDKGGTLGRLIHENVGLGWNIANWGRISTPSADTQSILQLESQGSNGASVQYFSGTRDPEGNVSASPGDIYVRDSTTLSRINQHRGSSSGTTGWRDVSENNLNVGFYGYRTSGTQSLTTGVEAKVEFPVKRDDPGSDFSISTDVFTAPEDGRYTFAASAQITLAAGGGRAELRIYSSTHGLISEGDSFRDDAGIVKPRVSASVLLDQNETIEIRAYQATGSSATIQNTGLNFTGTQISRV
jgi:hypothetical protein